MFVAPAAATARKTASEIAFIDASVASIESLIAGLRPGIEVHLLSPNHSATQQIAAAVSGRIFEAVHILAHGQPGEVAFSAGALSLETLRDHSCDLADIGRAMSDDGSLLLWSCHSGQGQRGAAFVDALSAATDAHVAASSQPIGAATLGGWWNLDELSSKFAVCAPVTPQGAAAYAGVMVLVRATAGEDIFNGLGGFNNTTAVNDTILYTAGNQVDNTLADPANNVARNQDSIDGGAGFDTIQIGLAGNGVTIDLGKASLVAPVAPPALFFNIEGLAFANTAGTSSVKLLAEQFGAGLISESLAVTGVANTVQAINISFLDAAATGGTFDGSNWTFTSWDSGIDTISILGSAEGDVITGTTAADKIDGNTGNDIINLANGYFAAGESITGGTNAAGLEADNIVLTNATTVDFTTGTLSQIELLSGSSGDDVVAMSFGQWGGFATSIDLGGGINTLNVVASTAGVGAGGGGGGVGTPGSISNVTTGNLVGTAGADTVTISGAQLDAIIIGAGTIDLGAATDTINLTSTSADLNALGASDAAIAGLENITLTGAVAGATVTLSGQSEAFTITGGAGADTIVAGSGADIISAGGGADSVSTGAGSDTIRLASGEFVAGESIDGGADADAIVLISNVTVDLSVGTILGVETLTGSAVSDAVTMSDAQWVGFSTIDLAGGANTLNVVASSDISAVATPTLLNIATGNLRGTAANDAITLSGAQLDAIIVGGGTIDLGIGVADSINLTSTSADFNTLGATNNLISNLEVISAATAAAGVTISLTGQLEAFTLTGSANADNLSGGAGADSISAGAGDDSVAGGAGGDNINGGIGADTISGGVGADTLAGGTGADLFNFAAGESVVAIAGNLTGGTIAGFDVITDFAPGSVPGTSDVIGYASAAIVANTASTDGTNSVLQLHTSAQVATHSIANGIITFDDAAPFAGPVALQSNSDVAAAVQYLQANNLGGAGASVAFLATLGGVAHTFVFIQGDAAGTNNLDELIDLTNVTATSITAAAGQISVFVAPVANPDTLAAVEDTAVTYAAASLLGNDINASSIASVTSGTGGTTVLNANGTITFTPFLNFNGPATFSYIASDGVLNSTSATVTINVAAVNDAPVALPDSNTATEDAPAVTGTVAANDSDVDIGAVLTYALNAPVAGLTLNSNGSYSFDPSNAAYQHLAQGATQSVIANYTVTDDQGATATSALTITVTGVNDTAVISGTATGAVAEDGALTAGNTLTVADADTGQNAYQSPASLAGTFGTFAFNATTGVWGYALANAQANVQALTGGQNVHDTLSVTSADGTATRVMDVTISGANDAASISGTSAGIVAEDAGLTAGNTLTVSDVDTGENRFATPASLAGAFGAFTFNAATGVWGYTLGNAQANVQGLAGGAIVHDTLTVTSLDGTAARVIDVTVTGANDAASITGTSAGAVTEDGGLTAGNTLTVSDADTGENRFATPGSLAGAFGTFTFNATTGVWGYSLANAQANVQALTAGQVVHDTLSVASLDGTSARVIDVAITGANDAPAAVADTGIAIEAGVTAGSNATGNVLANDTDVDTGDTKTVSTTGVQVGSHGTLTLNADGSYSYAVNNTDTAVNALRLPADTLTDTFNYTMHDAAGATSTSALTITIQGANDAPVAQNDSGSATEAGVAAGQTATGNVLANDTDADAGDTKTVTTPTGGLAGAHGTLALNADGTYTYAVNDADAAVNALRLPGDTLTDTFNYTVSDKAGAASSAALTITIHGANDAPVAVSDAGNAFKAGSLPGSNATGNVLLNDIDPDTGDTKFVTTPTAHGGLAGAHGTLTLNADGSYDYALNNADAAVIALHLATDVLTETFSYTMSDTAGALSTANLVIKIHGANDAPVITAAGASSGAAIVTAENTKFVANLTATDTGLPDQVLKWSLASGAAGYDNALFAVDATTGALSFLAAPDFESTAHTAHYKVSVSVSDGLATTSRDVFVNVSDVAPVIADIADGIGRTLTGTSENDSIFGLGGSDHLFGRDGNDIIVGGAGNDFQFGESGNDILTGGTGKDRMTGGDGLDVFDFNAVLESRTGAARRDVVTDFKHLSDKIDLKDIDASTKLPGDQAFKFIGQQVFHHVAGELHVIKFDKPGSALDMTIVEGDRNGDGIADFQIELSHLVVLTKADFVL